MEKVNRELQKTTNYAKLLEEKIEGRVNEAKAKTQAEEEAQSGEVRAGGKAINKKGVDESAIRKLTIKELHDGMDKQVGKRVASFRDAALRRDTTT